MLNTFTNLLILLVVLVHVAVAPNPLVHTDQSGVHIKNPKWVVKNEINKLKWKYSAAGMQQRAKHQFIQNTPGAHKAYQVMHGIKDIGHIMKGFTY